MFPINREGSASDPGGWKALHSTMFPINLHAGESVVLLDNFTFHYVSY